MKQIGLVSEFDVSLETQLVNVTGAINEADLVTKIGKTGKEVGSECGFMVNVTEEYDF